MRVCVLRAPGRLELAELPEPVPGPDEVLVEVDACGVCHTDLQILDGDLPARREPLVLGHQVAGRLAGGEPVGVAWHAGAAASAGAAARTSAGTPS